MYGAGLLEDMVRRVAGLSGYIAMVVDDKTLKILSACCSVYDALYKGVTGACRREVEQMDMIPSYGEACKQDVFGMFAFCSRRADNKAASTTSGA